MIEVLLAVFLVAIPGAVGDATAPAVAAFGVFAVGVAGAVAVLAAHSAWDTFWRSV